MSGRAFLTRLARPSAQALRGALAPMTGRTVAPMAQRAFTTSLPARGHGLTDRDLVQKLKEELSYEQEQEKAEGTPSFISSFIEQGAWEMDDEPGTDEFSLHRTFGNEKITVKCSISDLTNNMDEEMDEGEEDPDVAAAESGDAAAMEREFQNARNDAKRVDGEDVSLAEFPVDGIITIEKPGQGVLTIEATFEMGEVGVVGVRFAPDSAVALANTAEGDWKRRYLYAGPQYIQLDEDLQTLFDSWIAERGINTGLSVFIPSYMEYKEQREYARWLAQIKGFVQA